MKHVLLFAIILLSCYNVVQQVNTKESSNDTRKLEYFVSSAIGDDTTGNGTVASPFATVNKTLKVVYNDIDTLNFNVNYIITISIDAKELYGYGDTFYWNFLIFNSSLNIDFTFNNWISSINSEYNNNNIVIKPTYNATVKLLFDDNWFISNSLTMSNIKLLKFQIISNDKKLSNNNNNNNKNYINIKDCDMGDISFSFSTNSISPATITFDNLIVINFISNNKINNGGHFCKDYSWIVALNNEKVKTTINLINSNNQLNNNDCYFTVDKSYVYSLLLSASNVVINNSQIYFKKFAVLNSNEVQVVHSAITCSKVDIRGDDTLTLFDSNIIGPKLIIPNKTTTTTTTTTTNDVINSFSFRFNATVVTSSTFSGDNTIMTVSCNGGHVKSVVAVDNSNIIGIYSTFSFCDNTTITNTKFSEISNWQVIKDSTYYRDNQIPVVIFEYIDQVTLDTVTVANSIAYDEAVLSSSATYSTSILMNNCNISNNDIYVPVGHRSKNSLCFGTYRNNQVFTNSQFYSNVYYYNTTTTAKVAIDPPPPMSCSTDFSTFSNNQYTKGGCAIGSYSAYNFFSCTKCRLGSIAPGHYSTECTDCDVGQTANTNATSSVCIPCPAGTYNAIKGSTCSKCNQFLNDKQYSKAGATECSSCASDEYYVGSQVPCKKCGFLQSTADKYGCKFSGWGYFLIIAFVIAFIAGLGGAGFYFFVTRPK